MRRLDEWVRVTGGNAITCGLSTRTCKLEIWKGVSATSMPNAVGTGGAVSYRRRASRTDILFTFLKGAEHCNVDGTACDAIVSISRRNHVRYAQGSNRRRIWR